jgi:penicillin-binding protein 2
MSQDADKYKTFSRRAVVLGGLKLGAFGALAARLGYLQISEQKKFKTLSDKNRIGHRLVTAPRGIIVDRFGVPLAVNNQNFRAFLVPEQIDDLDNFFTQLRNYFPLTPFEEEEIRIEISKQRSFTPVLVKEGLTWDQTARIEFNLPDLPGLFIDEGEVRNYPLGQSTAHIVGYVGRVNESELTDDPIMTMPGFRIGKSGIEKQYDLELRGKTGSVQTEVNAVGREIRRLKASSPQQGNRVTLTIDAELQNFCQAVLSQEKSASCVVMDADNGEIYAMVSSPSFDPNLFTQGISAEQYAEVDSTPGHPFINKTISGAYPPGSTFKMITALAALEEGVITQNTSFTCTGYHEIGRDRFHCWKRSGHGRVDLIKSLEQSCDVFYYEVAEKLGIEKIAAMARKFGMGHKLGVDLPSERPGLVPDKDWKRGHFGSKWQVGETVVASIGQGYLQTTPLQLATMTARLVNGGFAVKPHIRLGEGDTGPFQKINVQKRHLDLIIRGMNAVTNKEKGTAHSSRIESRKWAMGGKTGTAQVKRITRAQRLAGIQNKDLPWKDRHHALFVAYAPINKPKYVCSVVVEHGLSGSGTAAPLAKEIMLEVQKRDPATKKETG